MNIDANKQVQWILSMLNSKQQVNDFLNGKKYFYSINNKTYTVVDGEKTKIVMGEDYNYIFDKMNGHFKRWGKTYSDDPEFSPIGAEILDIEITTSCNGINGKLCRFCYKSNTPNGKNMSFETFQSIIDKIGPQLTQVAFGADSEARSNPDLWKMAKYCRDKGVIPNITVANISEETADKLVSVMGAVSVSRYEDKDVCYNSIQYLTDRGLKQCNMHFMISEESYQSCLETLRDIKTDPRLKKLNAIVFLSLKKKGRGIHFHSLSSECYTNLVNYCIQNDINFGMDSCGAKKFLDAIKDHPQYREFQMVCEPCESTLFSQYIDVDAKYYPCSFCESINKWEEGIDVTKASNFLEEIWYNDRVKEFRDNLLSNCNNCHKARECPIYEI